MIDLNYTQENSLKELSLNYELTKFNHYPKIRLFHNTGITDKELYEMHKEGLIERNYGIRDTLIKLTDTGIKHGLYLRKEHTDKQP